MNCRSLAMGLVLGALGCGGSGGVDERSDPLPARPQTPGQTAPAATPEIGVVDVTDAGCTPTAVADDGKDDAPAFQCALDKLAEKGGILHVPAGTFDIHSTLVIPRRVTVAGTGFGSVLAQPHALKGPVLRMQAMTILRDLMLTQEHPLPGDTWAPYDDYDFQVKVEGDQSTVSGIKLLNPLLGILVSPADPNGAVGQILVSNLRGQPLREGIRIDHALDVIHVEQLHLWPFWSAAPAVLRWTVAHGTAIHSYRNDNPLFSQLFFFAYQKGLHFDQSAGSPTSGITSKPKVSQMDCDACGVAVHVTGANTRGVLLSQVSSQGVNDDWGAGVFGGGVFVEAPGAMVSLEQGDFAQLAANAVRVSGANAIVTVSATTVRVWNASKQGFPAFELVGGAAANPGATFTVDRAVLGNGHGAPPASPGVAFTNPVLDAPL